MGFVEYVLASATVSTILVAALGWATKSIISERLKNAIKHEYDEKLATHKAELKSQSDIEVERLRSNLSIAATEHQIRFSNLHEKQAEIIANTYAKLKDFHAKIGDYVKIFEPAGDKPKEERRAIAAKAHDEFINFYSQNQIYLSKRSVELIDEIKEKQKGVFFQFLYGIEAAPNNSGNGQEWLAIFNEVKDEIPQVLSKLEDEFRQILGNNS